LFYYLCRRAIQITISHSKQLITICPLNPYNKTSLFDKEVCLCGGTEVGSAARGAGAPASVGVLAPAGAGADVIAVGGGNP